MLAGPGALVGIVLLYCTLNPARPTVVLLAETESVVARASGTPRDARLHGESGVLVLDASGALRQFEWIDASWQERPALGVVAGAGGRLEASGEGVWLWEPMSATLRQIHGPAPAPILDVPLLRPEEVFVAGTQGGAPRSHGRLLVVGPHVIFERRAFAPQRESTVTPGFLVTLDPGSGHEDTLHVFSAPSYSRVAGDLIACCMPPPIFSPQAHWAALGEDRIAFFPGDGGFLKILPVGSGKSVDSVSLEIESRTVRDRHRLRYAARQAEAYADWSAEERKGWVRRLRRSRYLLREAFSDRVPTATQLFVVDSAEVWLRHFDPSLWEHGLADDWTLVNLRERTVVRLSMPGLGLVHDLERRGVELRVLWSGLVRSGEFEIVVSTFNAGEWLYAW